MKLESGKEKGIKTGRGGEVKKGKEREGEKEMGGGK